MLQSVRLKTLAPIENCTTNKSCYNYISNNNIKLYIILSSTFSQKGKKSAKKPTKKKSKAKDKQKTSKNQSDDETTPVRQSRRIAQIKIKEEAERRHQEEVALRELKMIHKKKVSRFLMSCLRITK